LTETGIANDTNVQQRRISGLGRDIDRGIVDFGSLGLDTGKEVVEQDWFMNTSKAENSID
jgi:hypothetical protein